MTVALTLAIILGYCLVGTFVGVKGAVRSFKRTSGDYEDATFMGVMLGLFWPFGIWLLVGTRLLDSALRRDERRQTEMADRERALAERERLVEAARRELENLT